MAKGWTHKMQRPGYLLTSQIEVVVGRDRRWIIKKCRELDLPYVVRIHKYFCHTTHKMMRRRWYEYPVAVASLLRSYTLQLDWRRIAQQHHLNVPDLFPSLNSQGRFGRFSVTSAPTQPASSLMRSMDSATVRRERDRAKTSTQMYPCGQKRPVSICPDDSPKTSSNS